MDSIIKIDHRRTAIPEKPVVLKNAFALLVLLVGMALFFTALPRVRAALNYLPVGYAIDKINNKDSLGEGELAQLIETARASISLDGNPRYWEGLSVLFMYQAQKHGLNQDAYIKLLKQAKQSAEQSLSRSPANANLWYRLATINSLLHLPPAQTVKMLLMSIMTGPNEPKLLIQRLNLCLILSPLLREDDFDLLRSQIIAAWVLSPADFLSVVANDGRQMRVVIMLLADNHNSVLEEMGEALENAP